jgi:hypothetical protein
MKLILLFSFSILCLSCSKKNEQFIAPEDISSVEEKSILSDVISELEDTFADIGKPLDLSRIPIIITNTLPLGTAGRCAQDSDSSTILINKNIFDDYDKNSKSISSLWSVLAHEIGHCYFGRAHTEKDIAAPNTKKFKNIYSILSGSSYYCFPNYRDTWSGTLMYEDYRIFVVPNSLKKFYIEELVGTITSPTLEDILKSPDVSLVDESMAPVDGTPISPVDCE